MGVALAFVAAAVLSTVLTREVRRYAVASSILDHPNDRSLHTLPTPRGGGVAIAFTFLAATLVLAILDIISARMTVGVVGGGLTVAVIGWIDDRRNLPARVRAAAHVFAAVWVLTWLGGLPSVLIGDHVLRLGLAGSVLGAIGIVWWINLYNFMDGIDGIAAGQALTAAGGAAFLIAFNGHDPVGILAAVLAGAAGGFLIFNWAPARIFMGDTGSGFIGFMFGTLAIASERSGSLPVVYWVLLSGVFIFDSTATLLRRVNHGERVYIAHLRHAYQRLVACGYSHRRVAISVILINLAIVAILAIPAIHGTGFVLAALTVIALLISLYLTVERRRPMYERRE